MKEKLLRAVALLHLYKDPWEEFFIISSNYFFYLLAAGHHWWNSLANK